METTIFFSARPGTKKVVSGGQEKIHQQQHCHDRREYAGSANSHARKETGLRCHNRWVSACLSQTLELLGSLLGSSDGRAKTLESLFHGLNSRGRIGNPIAGRLRKKCDGGGEQSDNNAQNENATDCSGEMNAFQQRDHRR